VHATDSSFAVIENYNGTTYRKKGRKKNKNGICDGKEVV